jgi:uncharacterized protein YggU (UPF0235/DUF167 family)
MSETIVSIRLTPRGGCSRLDRFEAQVLHARVAPAPADGEANRALLQLLAEALDVPKSSLEIVSGAASRQKRVRIPLTQDQFEKRLRDVRGLEK